MTERPDRRIDAAGEVEAVDAVVQSTDLGPPSADRGTPGHDLARASARRSQAISLRLGGATYEQIAQVLGYHDKAHARDVVVRALKTNEARLVEDLRDVENARLDRMQTTLWPIVTEPDHRDCPRCDGDGVEDGTQCPRCLGVGVIPGRYDVETRLRAVDRVLRVSKARRDLNGMDAPKKIEVSGDAAALLEDALAELRDAVAGSDGSYSVTDLPPAEEA